MSRGSKHERMYSSFVGNKVNVQANGQNGRRDVNRVGSGFTVGGTDIPSITLHRIVLAFASFPYFWRPTNIERADVREQGYDNGRATPDGAIVAAAFAMVLVSLPWAGVAVTLRVVGVVHMLDVPGD
jgi:hypothetical protein